MNQTDGEEETEKAKIDRIVTRFEVGCLALILVSIGAMLIANEALEYEFSGNLATDLPEKITGGKSYVYCNGFVDVSCDYYVSSDDAPDDLHKMAHWFTDSPQRGSFLISADGRLVVTESDLSKYEYDSPYPKPGGQLQLLYTHAFDLETMEHVKQEDNTSSGNEAAHRARHEVIAKMLETHGGIGSRFTLSTNLLEMRRMGYWEWRRWRKMVNAAYNRRSND